MRYLWVELYLPFRIASEMKVNL